jgi:hypothetical protein
VLRCLEPPPLLSWEDYHGPFQKVVGVFARKLELESVRPPRYKPGTVLCFLEVKDKFILLVRDGRGSTMSFLSGNRDQSLRSPCFSRHAPPIHVQGTLQHDRNRQPNTCVRTIIEVVPVIIVVVKVVAVIPVLCPGFGPRVN